MTNRVFGTDGQRTYNSIMQISPNPAQLDDVLLEATQVRMVKQLKQCLFELQYLRGEFATLAQQPELSANYQLAYGEMCGTLHCAEQGLRKAIAQRPSRQLTKPITSFESLTTPQEIAEIRRTIADINRAEIALVNQCASSMALMKSQDKSGLIDWDMSFEYDYAVILETGPARTFYQSCGDGAEPLKISLGKYVPMLNQKDGSPYNWNIFAGHTDHPLKDDHHGYLVHCLTDHGVIPWQMIAHIKAIEVNLEYSTYEKLWERAK